MNKVEIPAAVREHVQRRNGRSAAYLALEPAATALLVVDMQNYFMADGELACCPQARGIVPNVNRLAETVRAKGGVVVWVQNSSTAEAVEGWSNLEELYPPAKRELRRARMTPGCDAFNLWPDLDVHSSDAMIVKTRYSAFIQGASGVETLLRQRGVENVLVTGVATNVCCESTARDAMMLGFRTVMISDGTATFTDAEHNASLISFMKYFGDVQSTEVIVNMLNSTNDEASTSMG